MRTQKGLSRWMPGLLACGVWLAGAAAFCAPARPLSAPEVREVPRTAKVIYSDIARVEKAMRKDQKELDRLAREWRRSSETDPEGELSLKMQGLRIRLEIAELRLAGLRQEMREAEQRPTGPASSAVRLEIAKQTSLVEDLRRQLLLARTEEGIRTATKELRREEERLHELRVRYWRETGESPGR